MLNAASVMSFSVLWSDRERAVSHMMGFPRDSSRNEACLSVYYHPTIHNPQQMQILAIKMGSFYI